MSAPSECISVALRIRPQTDRESSERCQVCLTQVQDTPQVTLGKGHYFTYDKVFSDGVNQETIYRNAVAELTKCVFEGYNATVLAYGQTGSGKTYTMGSSLSNDTQEHHLGILPHAAVHLFHLFTLAEREDNIKTHPPAQGISDEIVGFEREANGENTKEKSSHCDEICFPKELKQLMTDLNADVLNEDILHKNYRIGSSNYSVSVSFIELYNDELTDLLSDKEDKEVVSRATPKKPGIQISEDESGVYLSNVKKIGVSSPAEIIRVLKLGSIYRTTASTCLNSESSRSHAIFTIYLDQKNPTSSGYDETLSSKFHFVDLAGSERLKRTNAVGQRAKEGIAINVGLLALGNVISILGDANKNSNTVPKHVPYRNSKLTRLLKDSLGGNSKTLMVACASPSDSDFMETHNTLKYAYRARNIKNKPVINEDLNELEVVALRKQLTALKLKLLSPQSSVSLLELEELQLENKRLKQQNEQLCMIIENDSRCLPLMSDMSEPPANRTTPAATAASQRAQDVSTVSFHKPPAYLPPSPAGRSSLQDLILGRDLDCDSSDSEALSQPTLSFRKKQLSNINFNSKPMVHPRITFLKNFETNINWEWYHEANFKEMQRRQNESKLLDLSFPRDKGKKLNGQTSLIKRNNRSTFNTPVQISSIIKELNEEILLKEANLLRLSQDAKKVDRQYKIQLEKYENENKKLSLEASKMHDPQKTNKQKMLEQKKELADLQREKSKLLRLKTDNEQKATRLRSEVDNLKTQKVDLQHKLRDMGNQLRKEVKNVRHEVIVLKKEKNKHQMKIARLEGENLRQGTQLKRKNEELSALKLKTRERNSSLGRTTPTRSNRTEHSSPRRPADPTSTTKTDPTPTSGKPKAQWKSTPKYVPPTRYVSNAVLNSRPITPSLTRNEIISRRRKETLKQIDYEVGRQVMKKNLQLEFERLVKERERLVKQIADHNRLGEMNKVEEVKSGDYYENDLDEENAALKREALKIQHKDHLQYLEARIAYTCENINKLESTIMDLKKDENLDKIQKFRSSDYQVIVMHLFNLLVMEKVNGNDIGQTIAESDITTQEIVTENIEKTI